MKSRILILPVLCLLLAGCANIGIQIDAVPPEKTPATQPVGTPLPEIPTSGSSTQELPTPMSPSVTYEPTSRPQVIGGASAILFGSNRSGTFEDLYLQDFGTHRLTRLTQGDTNTFPGPFSPDGKKMLFTGFGLTESYVGVMNADGSNVVNLTNLSDVSDGFPAWSPDGTQIAFTSRRDQNNELYLMDAYGYNLKRLTFDPKDDFAPAWSPDGKRIAFVSDRDNNTGENSIYIMNAAASWVVRLTNDGGNDYAPAWSPDGTTIVFRSDQKGHSDIYSVPADGNNIAAPANLTNTPDADEWNPQWSPDGSLIAFQTNRDGNWEIYIMDVNGANPVNITNNPADDQQPFWQKAN